MNRPTPFSTATLPFPNLISRSPLQRGFLLVALTLAWFALSPAAQAQDGGLPNDNTAEGTGSLQSLTTGFENTAIGFDALFSNTTGGENIANGSFALEANTTGSENTASGFEALFFNTTGNNNTAIGLKGLFSNTTGINNTASGFEALLSNTTGNFNMANGSSALSSNSTGSNNTANGASALFSNTTGNNNTATGLGALSSNTTGNDNTANGYQALFSNTTGINNTANGFGALNHDTTGHDNTGEGFQALLKDTTGSSNIALGSNAGTNLTTGSNNIDIGNNGIAGESNKIRIGKVGTQNGAFIAGIHGVTVASAVGVVVDVNGHLGTVTSSARFKEAIKPMDKASEAILSLEPVTFRYKHELDPDGVQQFGLVAEQVEKVNPALVVRDADGKINTVRYEAVNAMLLNEFLKEHRIVQEQQATIAAMKSAFAKQETTIARQQNQIEGLTATVQKVSDRLELSKPAPQLVADNQ